MRNFVVCCCLMLVQLSWSQIDHSLLKINLDSTSQHTGFEVFDDFVGDKRLVFSGENHRYSYSNNALKYKQAMYLYDKGFRYLSLELGEGIAYLSNEYIHTGDDKLLELLFRTKDFNKHPMYMLLNRLQKFNQDKEEDEKIKIVGLDYTRYPTYSLEAMAYILEKNKLQDSLPIYYEDIRVIANAQESNDDLGFQEGSRRIETFDITANFKSYTNKLFQLSIQKLILEYKRDKQIFKRLLDAKEFEDFDFLMREIEVTLDWYRGEGMTYQIHTGRERHLAERAKDILERDSTAKISGQFGRCHIRNDEFSFPCYSIDLDSFVRRIQKDSIYKDEVAVIPILYLNEDDIELHEDAPIRRIKRLLDKGSIYIYETNSDLINYKKEEAKPRFYYINTMNLIEDKIYSTVSSREELFRDYKEKFTETSIIELSVNQNLINYKNINNDLGFRFLKPSNPRLGIGYYQSSGDSHVNLRFNFSIPVEQSLDSASYRFTQWSISENIGFNSIFVKNFTLYHGFKLEGGSAKIREELLVDKGDFLYSYTTKSRTYKNPFFNVGLSTGFQLKFFPMNVFAEASYMVDLSKKRWRDGGIITQSSELNFTGLELRCGIVFYLRDN